MMKKVVLIAVIALLAFCSCKKADQSEQETNCLNEQNTNLTEQDTHSLPNHYTASIAL